MSDDVARTAMSLMMDCFSDVYVETEILKGEYN
jgi:hypothetical protein